MLREAGTSSTRLDWILSSQWVRSTSVFGRATVPPSKRARWDCRRHRCLSSRRNSRRVVCPYAVSLLQQRTKRKLDPSGPDGRKPTSPISGGHEPAQYEALSYAAVRLRTLDGMARVVGAPLLPVVRSPPRRLGLASQQSESSVFFARRPQPPRPVPWRLATTNRRGGPVCCVGPAAPLRRPNQVVSLVGPFHHDLI